MAKYRNDFISNFIAIFSLKIRFFSFFCLDTYILISFYDTNNKM